ncbi:hypothetical protein HYV83_04255 [Candidatus Woesearchaeota archaeon]|nr:hypothetical protein [Candidatus Woesearchaeota archaeon]
MTVASTAASGINLDTLPDLVNQMLPGYTTVEPGLEFGYVPLFVLTPDKSNTARTIVPVRYNGLAAGDLVVIAFRPGDGTGDESTYKVGQLAVHEDYKGAVQQKILPRAKTGIIVEGFFPLFTIAQSSLLPPEDRHELPKDLVIRYAVALDELVVDSSGTQPIIRKGFLLGSDAFAFRHNGMPAISLTTGYLANGERFGDPHSIHYRRADKPNYFWDAIQTQVCGFLAIKGKENPLFNAAARWATPTPVS